MTPVDLAVYAILDPERTRGRPLDALADCAVRGGATILQLRDKHAGTRLFIERAREIKAAIAGRIPFVINDRVDVALAAGVDGVHLGKEDMTAADARALLGPQAIIGLTLKDEGDVAGLDPRLVSYGCIGGVFPTVSKDNPAAPVGLGGLTRLRAAARHSGLPVGAIAGIDHGNAAAVIAAGADGVAVISALFMADDVTAATTDLARIVNTALATRRM